VLFPYIKRWRCEIQQHRIQLYIGDELHNQLVRQPAHPLDEQLQLLFSVLPPHLPWCDSMEFVLDMPDLRYLLVPWQPGITTPAELRHYACALQAEQQGTPCDGMQVSIIHGGYGSNGFAALLESTLLEQLKTTVNRLRLRFRGCNTPFSKLLTSFGRRLPENALFACVGAHESSFAIRVQQQWHSVFTLHLPATKTHQQLDIANQLAGLPPLERYVVHTGYDTTQSPHHNLLATGTE
jgi:hypothetical protein